jgi:hypothetical protein
MAFAVADFAPHGTGRYWLRCCRRLINRIGEAMKLLKLMAYALFGYALYEFVRGMMEEEPAAPPHRARPRAAKAAE